MAYDNSNSGTLSRNADKNKEGANPKWPDYKGKATVNGVEYWISGWVKAKDGSKFISLSFKPKEEQKPKPAPTTQPKPSAFADPQAGDDDIPF